MKKFTPYLFLIITILALSCKSDDTVLNPPPPDPPDVEVPDFGTVETIIPNGDEKYLNNNSEYIFDQNKLHTIEINLPEAALAHIDADPTAEEYVEGSLTFEGETISPVGIRYKGSVGAFVDCLSGTNWSNPSGHKTCTKLSMKIKINWEGRDEKFYGLKKLQLHSQNLDDSHMRERLGYWLFRQMGVPAPRSVHARVIINGEYSGLYALTEQIDGRFTRYNFDDGEGNLYKEVWPINYAGFPHDEQTYLDALKTNEDENPSIEMLRTFGAEIANASDNELQSVITDWMILDEIISYAVVDRTIRNDDGAFHWYCTGNWCSNHNYYWYEETTAGTVHLIPWDLDNAFENIISDANPVTPIADAWGETSNNCEPFSYGVFNIPQWSAACDRLTAGWASFEDEYAQKLQAFKEGPLSESAVSAKLDAWENQIRDAVIEAYETHGDAISEGQWQFALNKLRQQAEYAREN